MPRGERHGDFDAGALGQRTIKIEKDAASADVLGFRQQVVQAVAGQSDRRRQAHVEAAHGTALRSGLLHRIFSAQMHGPRSTQNSPQTAGTTHWLEKCGARFTDLAIVCKRKKHEEQTRLTR